MNILAQEIHHLGRTIHQAGSDPGVDVVQSIVASDGRLVGLRLRPRSEGIGTLLAPGGLL